MKRGNISDVEYEDFIKSEIARWIKIQEDLDIDVLVHGEFERVDMVEFFGQKLAGFTTTKLGWVQSYGSRAVKPPIIYGDVKHIQPLSVKEVVYAQSLTDRPVKGMLTGPITITNWSFERSDISRADLFNQIGLAIKDEIKLLEDAGIAIIQVDEAALREGLPLRKAKQKLISMTLCMLSASQHRLSKMILKFTLTCVTLSSMKSSILFVTWMLM